MGFHLLLPSKDNKEVKDTEVVADTGAEVTAGGPQHLKHFGLTVKDLTPPDLALQHAGGNALKIIGSYTINITHNNQTIEDEIYFAEGVSNIYLCCDSCKGIRIIHENFPHVDLFSFLLIFINPIFPVLPLP